MGSLGWVDLLGRHDLRVYLLLQSAHHARTAARYHRLVRGPRFHGTPFRRCRITLVRDVWDEHRIVPGIAQHAPLLQATSAAYFECLVRARD